MSGAALRKPTTGLADEGGSGIAAGPKWVVDDPFKCSAPSTAITATHGAGLPPRRAGGAQAVQSV